MDNSQLECLTKKLLNHKIEIAEAHKIASLLAYKYMDLYLEHQIPRDIAGILEGIEDIEEYQQKINELQEKTLMSTIYQCLWASVTEYQTCRRRSYRMKKDLERTIKCAENMNLILF